VTLGLAPREPREGIEVGNGASVHRLIEREQACLVSPCPFAFRMKKLLRADLLKPSSAPEKKPTARSKATPSPTSTPLSPVAPSPVAPPLARSICEWGAIRGPA
jgi:hypothetical protein